MKWDQVFKNKKLIGINQLQSQFKINKFKKRIINKKMLNQRIKML